MPVPVFQRSNIRCCVCGLVVKRFTVNAVQCSIILPVELVGLHGQWLP